jgi:hypothetical protein
LCLLRRPSRLRVGYAGPRPSPRARGRARPGQRRLRLSAL